MANQETNFLEKTILINKPLDAVKQNLLDLWWIMLDNSENAVLDNKIKSSTFVVLIYSKRKTKNKANANFRFICSTFWKRISYY